MRIRYIALVVCTLALVAPAGAQDQDVSAAVRKAVRDAMRAAREAVRQTAREAGRAYQEHGGPEQTERVSRIVRLGPNGSVSVSNIAGDIVVSGGNGDTVSIEAVKRTRGGREELGRVEIGVSERAGRVDITTNHFGRRDRVSVDFTITVPASAAVDAHSVSGNVKVTGVRGAVRGETVSGNIVMASTPRLEAAKSVSGDVELTGAAADGDLTATSVSGSVRANGLKARGLQVGSVSGDIVASDVTCDRLAAKSVSGDIEFSGALTRGGRYEVTTHSGDIRLTLPGRTGFELNAASFSGSIRSDFPLTIAGGQTVRRRGPGQAMHATFSDGSAALTLNTFSGDIVIAKR